MPKIAAYIGMIPMCHSSGEKDGMGDITVRKHAAMNLVYTENCKRMPASKAIVKVARKLVNRIFFVLKHETEYVYGVVS